MEGEEVDGTTEKKVKEIETRMTAFLTGIRGGQDPAPSLSHLTASSKLMSRDDDDEQLRKEIPLKLVACVE